MLKDKEQTDLTKSRVDVVAAVFSLGWKAIAFVGGMIFVAYCWLENILPLGLSAGDVVFLASAAFALAVITLVGTGYGTFATLWFLKALVASVNAFNRHKKNPPAPSKLHASVDSWGMLVCSVFLAIVISVIAYFAPRPDPDMHFGGTLLFFGVLGLFLGLVFLIESPTTQQRNVRFTLIACALAVFGSLVATRPSLLNVAMESLGVRSVPGQTVLVSAAAHTQLAGNAEISGVRTSFCKLDGTDRWATRNARVVWLGIGDVAYIRLFDAREPASRNILVRVNRADVDVARGENLEFRCPAESTNQRKS
ncbi:hypothetical protein [Caballeronia sp. AZ10_KS36]|uniref:hypothetical protein n=1 Tax=Caballeronia sp. AZ10_KS36 TaxID=2921757 RepID=UPI002029640A|nr:hypothetical protein [Caballeronia sp. AZ10_KS36]